jgi:DNA-binding CsgD family transcriptional regulator
VDATAIDSLTERELEIARLVVGRKTNPEIAAELSLGLQTVETDLRNTLRKLGVGTRVELAPPRRTRRSRFLVARGNCAREAGRASSQGWFRLPIRVAARW